MDFFADGGFQQLFCDLNDHYSSEEWDNSLEANPYYTSPLDDYDYGYGSEDKDITALHEENCQASLYIESHEHVIIMDRKNSFEIQNLTDISDKQIQCSLDYLLNTSSNYGGDSLDMQYEDRLYAATSHPTSPSPLSLLSYPGHKDLSDWEEKFLDNFVEIPELVHFLPEKTPLCNDNCNHFLQESAENLKLFATPPSSPAGLLSSDYSATPVKSKHCRGEQHSKENDKTYPCNFGDCGKIYAKPAHLKAHLRRHMGEKPYICTWSDCTWRFSRSDELARHRRSHSGVKPYKCDFCAKCFARSDHLTKHRKVHERRLLAASKAGKMLGGVLPQSVLTVRPGRKRKNQL